VLHHQSPESKDPLALGNVVDFHNILCACVVHLLEIWFAQAAEVLFDYTVGVGVDPSECVGYNGQKYC
jgi:hypothetical protein